MCSDCANNIDLCTSSKIVNCKICGKPHLKGTKCDNEFCKKHNLKQFSTLIKYFGFDEKTIGTQNIENEFNRVRQILYDLYWCKGLCGAEIGNLYGYKNTHNITQKIFTYLEILTRNNSQFVINSYLHNRNGEQRSKSKYKTKWHITWNNKHVFLRSSYEIEYAKELDRNKIEYEVESLRIKYFDTQRNEYRCAIPDFYIPNENLIIEIKFSWTLDIQNMKDKFKAYEQLGYNTKLILDKMETNLLNL